MSKDTTFTMRIDSERKAQWKELAEEEGFSGISDMVTFAVTQVQQGNIGQGGDVGTQESHVPEDLEARLKRIESKVDDVDDDMDVVKREVTASRATSPASSVVMEVLPEGDGFEDGIMPDTIAQNFGASMSDVENTLDRLASRTSIVKREDKGDRVYYWKDV